LNSESSSNTVAFIIHHQKNTGNPFFRDLKAMHSASLRVFAFRIKGNCFQLQMNMGLIY